MSIPALQSVPVILTTGEAAEVLRCAEGTVVNYIHRHELQAVLIGRERRIRGEDLLDFIADRQPTNGSK